MEREKLRESRRGTGKKEDRLMLHKDKISMVRKLCYWSQRCRFLSVQDDQHTWDME
jgi:hypothetical protein